MWGPPLLQNGSGNTSNVYDQPEFIASVAAGGFLFILVVVAHMKACRGCCAIYRQQRHAGLLSTSSGNGTSGRPQTPLINDENDEAAYLLSRSTDTVGFVEPGPDGCVNNNRHGEV